LRKRALSRAGIEIENASLAFPADLYIAHHASVLPAAVAAARKHKGRVGYDVEDFYSGMWTPETGPGAGDRALEAIEEQYLRSCDYITASSPEVADAYVARYGVRRPITVLNVFPIGNRPAAFRPTAKSGPLRLYWFSQCIGVHRGIEDAVRAMGLLQGCDVELYLQGNWQHGYRQQLLGLAAQSGVDARRIHSQEWTFPDNMVRASAEYDVGLALELPHTQNRRMCLANKVFTYLLSGNAAIGTATPAQQKLLAGLGTAAAIYRPGDAAAMAAHLRRWHDNREALDEARRCAWSWGERRYHWEFEQRFFLEAVDVACGRQRGAG
jgi:glycosyltransferase involved in cell wall biosynthesis